MLNTQYIFKVYITDKKGRTCLHVASSYGHYNMVALLISNGAELGAKDKVCSFKSYKNKKVRRNNDKKLCYAFDK